MHQVKRLKKASGDLDYIENTLVTTIDTVGKKWESKQNVVGEAKTCPVSEKKIQTQSTKQRNHKHKKNSPYLQKNKSNTLNSIYKARSTPRTNLSNKITIIEKPTEIDILKDNENVSLSSGQGDDLASITPDHLHISRKNKIKKTPDTLVIIKRTYSRTSQL